LRDGRQALVASWPDDTFSVALFDRDGRFLEMQRCGPLSELARQPDLPEGNETDSEELLPYLLRELGFELGLIHVKEVAAPEELSIHLIPAFYLGVLENPDSPVAHPDEEFRQVVGSYIHRWLRHGDFVLDWTNDFWAGPDGEIHSS
jgi:hypothetical protein